MEGGVGELLDELDSLLGQCGLNKALLHPGADGSKKITSLLTTAALNVFCLNNFILR